LQPVRTIAISDRLETEFIVERLGATQMDLSYFDWRSLDNRDLLDKITMEELEDVMKADMETQRTAMKKIELDTHIFKFERFGMSGFSDGDTGYGFEYRTQESEDNAVHVYFLLSGGPIPLCVCHTELVDPTGNPRFSPDLNSRTFSCSRARLYKALANSKANGSLKNHPLIEQLSDQWLESLMPYIIAGWEMMLSLDRVVGRTPKIKLIE
jgi:hypothetical protein